MFLPNNFGMLSRKSADFDTFGQESYGVPSRVACSVVSLVDQRVKTPIRSETSASKSTADEDTVKGMILFPIVVQPNIGDAFEIAGVKLRFLSVEPRFDAFGSLDHYETELEALPGT